MNGKFGHGRRCGLAAGATLDPSSANNYYGEPRNVMLTLKYTPKL
ncbi:hypothetical protein [Rugamonas rubra]|nr:hypothetical protein [Rugamonas rubra]